MSDWVVPQRKGSSVRAAQCKRAVCAHLRLHDPDLIRATDNGSPLQDIRTAPVASRVTAATDLIRFSNRAATDWQSYNCSLFCCLILKAHSPNSSWKKTYSPMKRSFTTVGRTWRPARPVIFHHEGTEGPIRRVVLGPVASHHGLPDSMAYTTRVKISRS